jgi:predicted O-linked N-acetylglucosamine transferase (SPINDLY family)
MSSLKDQNIVLQMMQRAYSHYQKGELAQAEKLYQQVLQKEPMHPDANQFLGIIAHKSGFHSVAAQLVSNAIVADPHAPHRHYILAGILNKLGESGKAISCYQRALELKPDFIEAQNNLGLLYKKTHQYDDAITCFKHVISHSPQSAIVWANLGNVYKEAGRMIDAIEAMETAIKLDPSFFAAYSNLLLALNYSSTLEPDYIFQKHQEWGAKCYASQTRSSFSFEGRKAEKKKLKIGYVSPDFHTHSVAYFAEPLIKSHKRDQFELYAYYNNAKSDETTVRLQASFDHWQNVSEITDNALADKIYADQIDILVDLAGHSAKNRLGVLAQKPAPVQVTWLGYPNTTGLNTVDYRITDAIADPPGESDRLNTEELIRLENGFLCYQGDQDIPVIEALPYDTNGYVTFGSFNNYVKITNEVIKLWAKILLAVPHSKLLLKSGQLSDQGTRERCISLFDQLGITADRILLQGMLAKTSEHMAYYSKVDLALDPFPYNGTTTTFEALWMGVPTVTYSGNVHASRVSASILSRVGLHDFISYSQDEYLEIAKSRASDIDYLRTLRRDLRRRMLESSLCDDNKFARQIENAYQLMWQNYCKVADI